MTDEQLRDLIGAIHQNGMASDDLLRRILQVLERIEIKLSQAK